MFRAAKNLINGLGGILIVTLAFMFIGANLILYGDSLSTNTYIDTNGGFGEYTGDAYIVVKNNEPTDIYNMGTEPRITLRPSAFGGKCDYAEAVITKDTLRNDKPNTDYMYSRLSGWRRVSLKQMLGADYSDTEYVFHQCQLVPYMLYGWETVEDGNYITGTCYLDEEAIQPIAQQIFDYVDSTGKVVWYIADPSFYSDEKLARGIHIQAMSEDGEFKLNVYCFNVHPDIVVDYKRGYTWKSLNWWVKKKW